MIKVDRHPICCDCADCVAVYPPGRFEVTWPSAEPVPRGDAFEAILPVPIGAAAPAMALRVWVSFDHDTPTPLHRLATDVVGFAGTRGAAVVVEMGSEPPRITGTHDPVLAALTADVPLRRKAIERFNHRGMVATGLAGADADDAIACAVHGEGLAALTCRHLTGDDVVDAVVVYGVDGDFPDLFCRPCLDRMATGDVSSCVTVCSRCQQQHIYRHHLVGQTVYGGNSR